MEPDSVPLATFTQDGEGYVEPGVDPASKNQGSNMQPSSVEDRIRQNGEGYVEPARVANPGNFRGRCYQVFSEELLDKITRNRTEQLEFGPNLAASVIEELDLVLEALQNNTSIRSLRVERPMTGSARVIKLLLVLQVAKTAKAAKPVFGRRNSTPTRAFERLHFEAVSFLSRRLDDKPTKLFKVLKTTLSENPKLKKLSIVSCKLDTQGCLDIVKMANALSNLDVLDLGNNSEGPEWENECSSDGLRAILEELKHKDLVSLSLPAPADLEMETCSEIEEFLAHSKVRELHLGSSLSQKTLRSLQEALSGTEATPPNLTLTRILSIEREQGAIKPYLERNKLVAKATAIIDKILPKPSDSDENNFESWSAESWRQMNEAIILIDKARSSGYDNNGAFLKHLGGIYPDLPLIYLQKGRLGAAYESLASLENSIEKTQIILQILEKMSDGPFLDSPAKRVFTILVMILKNADSAVRDEWLQMKMKDSIGNVLGPFPKVKEGVLHLLSKGGYTENDEYMYDRTVDEALKDLIGDFALTKLDEARMIAPLSEDATFGTMHEWALEALSKEMTFRELFDHCQDYRYGDSSVDKAISTLTEPLIMERLNRRFADPLEKLWTLEHLLWLSLQRVNSYTRRNKRCLLNYRGIGFKLRTGVFLSATQELQYKMIKNLGVGIVDETLASGGASSEGKEFIRNDVRYFGFNLTKYVFALKEVTTSKKRVNKLLEDVS